MNLCGNATQTGKRVSRVAGNLFGSTFSKKGADGNRLKNLLKELSARKTLGQLTICSGKTLTDKGFYQGF